jgi:hypothetical protein
MKKLLMLLVVAVFLMTQLVAQESSFLKGDKVVNFGLGLGSIWYTGTYYKTQVPPVSASFEIGIVDNILEKAVIGVGGYMAYSSYKSDYGTGGWKYSNVVIGARGNFHYPLVDHLDTYAGVMLGYNIATDKAWGNYSGSLHSTSYGGIRTAEYVGARYYFSNNFAAMAEIGYGVTILNFGVSLKF